ncbi:MAG: chromosomal replication initiator protein DnaA, partial [Serpentinimonas sp.]|nr:chromosomal replication initiator protein DnaA [Serpentinimonas sp.]
MSLVLIPPEVSEPAEALWSACVQRLALELPAQQFNTWIRPLAAQVSQTADSVTLLLPSRFKLDCIRTQYAARIAAALQAVAGRPVALELVLASRPSARATLGKPAPARATPADAAADALGHDAEAWTMEPASSPVAASAATAKRAEPLHRLNSGLTFATLVEGTANRMARAAAMHVAHHPGQLYNPLFIYGGVGLGKTHLMHAIGNQLLAGRSAAKVLYVHAEQFVTDVVKSYQRKTFDEFKARYHSLDLLLIDDVQFFANKERTQEEFFNAFEALLAKKSHIVMTSDTYPKGLADIHERLVSRFDAGLTVAIEPPELEMRVAILISKAEAESERLPEDVAFFVAKNVRSNVRELE